MHKFYTPVLGNAFLLTGSQGGGCSTCRECSLVQVDGCHGHQVPMSCHHLLGISSELAVRGRGVVADTAWRAHGFFDDTILFLRLFIRGEQGGFRSLHSTFCYNSRSPPQSRPRMIFCHKYIIVSCKLSPSRKMTSNLTKSQGSGKQKKHVMDLTPVAGLPQYRYNKTKQHTLRGPV